MPVKAQKRGKKALEGWFSLLLAARRAAKAGTLTSQTMGYEAGIASSAASAWLAKFVSWGYARRAGSVAGGNRWIRVYELTESGEGRGVPKGRMVFKKA